MDDRNSECIMKRLALLLLLTSCITTEIIGEPLRIEADSVMTKKPRPLPPRDTTDTTRIPISFNPSVGDWDETEIDY